MTSPLSAQPSLWSQVPVKPALGSGGALQAGNECTRQQEPPFNHVTSGGRPRWWSPDKPAPPGPDCSPIQAPQEGNASFLPTKFLLPSLLHASDDKPYDGVMQKLEDVGDSVVQWKLPRPGVQARVHISLTTSLVSHLSANFFIGKAGVMTPTSWTAVLEKDKQCT